MAPHKENLRRKLPKLVADHLLRDGHVVIHLAVVHLELQADEVRQNGRGPRLRPDRWDLLSWGWACDGEPAKGRN